MHKILVVEDDVSIREGIESILTENNYIVVTADDGAQALSRLKKEPPDLVVLDLNLPKISGETVCREIKKTDSKIPVIILTAKGHTTDVLNGFKLGADDYISKPFDLEVLLARIKARLKKEEQEKITVGDLEINTASIKVTRGGREIKLSPHEFKLLHYLALNKGNVLSRDMILSRVWQYSYDIDTRVVDVYIGYLRKKIDADFEKKIISSVRGFGYLIKE